MADKPLEAERFSSGCRYNGLGRVPFALMCERRRRPGMVPRALEGLMQVRVVICIAAAWSLANSDLLRAQQNLTLNASHFGGGFDMRHDWKVQLVGSKIKVERPGRRTRVQHVSASTLNTLSRSLRENDIFALRNVYGCSACSDNPCCTLEITDGVNTRRVHVYASPPGSQGFGVQDSGEIGRFLSVWKMVKQLAGLSSAKDACR